MSTTPTYEIGQRFTFTVGDAVVCNGYPGRISKVCDGALDGMVEVRLERGGQCLGACYPDVYPLPTLQCDGDRGCTECVTHVDDKGWVYCKSHGLRRRRGGTPCRILKPHEIETLRCGRTINYR